MEVLDGRCQGGRGGGDAGVPGPVVHVIDKKGFASTRDMYGLVVIWLELSGPQLGGELADLLGVWRLWLVAELGPCPGRW